MKNFVRWTSLGFAVFASLFWSVVDVVMQILTQIPGYGDASSSWVATSLPFIPFGVACVVFCHWFAKKLIVKMRTLD